MVGVKTCHTLEFFFFKEISAGEKTGEVMQTVLITKRLKHRTQTSVQTQTSFYTANSTGMLRSHEHRGLWNGLVCTGPCGQARQAELSL